MLHQFLFFLFFVVAVNGLKCYTGFALIRGQTVGTTFETCEDETDYCYRAMADFNFLTAAKKAGCSTWRCMVNHNKCIRQNIAGTDVEFCCCNDKDLCNIASRHWPLLPIIASFAIKLFH